MKDSGSWKLPPPDVLHFPFVAPFIFDEIGSELTKLTDQVIDMLKWDIKDQKWIKGLKAILKDLNKVEDTIAKHHHMLGLL